VCEQVTAYISLGSNLGQREETLRAALRELDELEGVEVTAVSRLRETAPVGGPAQDNYINAVAEVRTSLAAADLLGALQGIEARFGRKRQERWGPRTLDLDLLLYGEAVIQSPELQVPHPRMHERLFVLEPLCEIAPHARNPTLGRSAAELLARLRGMTQPRGGLRE